MSTTAEELAALRAENATLRGQLAVSQLTPELARAGIRPEAHDDALARISKAYRFDSERGKLVPVGADVPGDVAEYLDQLKASAPHLFGVRAPTVIGGSARPEDPAVNPFKKESFNLTKQGQIAKRDPARAKRMAAEAGIELKL